MPCSYNGQSTKIVAILYKGKTAMDVCIGLVRDWQLYRAWNNFEKFAFEKIEIENLSKKHFRPKSNLIRIFFKFSSITSVSSQGGKFHS